tara:strand:+ start:62 stop:1210 length:1149 start_codon:yes stop_codon:yes gene_type:complete
MLRIAIVTGEPSGDMLGAGLVHELSKKVKDISIEGIGGEKLANEHMNILFPMEKLSVMGFTEVLGRYFELKDIREKLIKHFLEDPPDIFIGIDAPDFNLFLEKKLRNAGIKTVHYVSPSIWAWRRNRIKKIRESVDLILNLFPFEGDIYNKFNIPNKYVGHPLADKLPDEPNTESARNELDIPLTKTVIALLPGSRLTEIKRIAIPLLKAALLTQSKHKNLFFISALTNEKSANVFKKLADKIMPQLKINIYIDKTHRVIESSDIIMLASGTASLEAMLLKKPMIVTYKLSWPTYFIVKLLAKIPYVSLPNILAGREIVPECLQFKCRPEILASELDKLLNSEESIKKLTNHFGKLSIELRKKANYQAANSVLKLIKNDKIS